MKGEVEDERSHGEGRGGKGRKRRVIKGIETYLMG